MKAKQWLIGWLLIVLTELAAIAVMVYKVDPYFHYHKPDVDNYFYSLDNERSQNNGISKHFDYDAIITGTSMVANFKTSEFDEVFKVNSVKIPYSGGSYKEINDNLKVALENNPNLKTIIRGLDYEIILAPKDQMRDDLGIYPEYLYDNNPLNDVKYIFNRDVLFGRVYIMGSQKTKGDFAPGITSFDLYSRWQYDYSFGVNNVLPNGVTIPRQDTKIDLTDADKKDVYENITQNVTSLADEYPDIDFYYFFTPYSVAWWDELIDSGKVYRQIKAEEYAIQLILAHPNIHLYSFNNRTDITTDLNNYKDIRHYGQWINSLMLKWIKDGTGLLTLQNYQEYIEEELTNYTSFDYFSLNQQVDYESDFYAAALINQELNGVEPEDILENKKYDIELSGAKIVDKQYQKGLGIECSGSLHNELGSGISLEDYLLNHEYIGAKIQIDDLEGHNYLVFYGKKVNANGQPCVYVYNEQNEKVAELVASYLDLDTNWHQYVIDLSHVEGGGDHYI